MTYEEILQKCSYKNTYGGIYLGDCLEGMKMLDDKSVDICFTSPPYNDYGTNPNDQHQKYLMPEINRGSQEDYMKWQFDIIDEMLRVTKKYVLYNIQGLKNNRRALYGIIGNYKNRIHDILIWYKPNGQPTSTKHKISNTYEMILVIKAEDVDGVDVESDFFRNVIVENSNRNIYADIHKAVMSKNIADIIIKEFSHEGDIVLDPFMGMGTTALTCMEQNKKFLGFEITDVYLKTSGDRLDKFINNKEFNEDFLE